MRRIVDCGSLEEVREHIDAIDRQIVELLAERGGYVRQVMRFKRVPTTCRRRGASSGSSPTCAGWPRSKTLTPSSSPPSTAH